MAAQQSRTEPGETQTPGAGSQGVEAYPYDPTLRIESQLGLDRLRCFADRALAANFLAVFRAAEHNTETAATAERELAQKRNAELQTLRRLAARAFAGELGAEPQELAAHLLLNEQGARATDEPALRTFAFALRQLKRLAG